MWWIGVLCGVLSEGDGRYESYFGVLFFRCRNWYCLWLVNCSCVGGVYGVV